MMSSTCFFITFMLLLVIMNQHVLCSLTLSHRRHVSNDRCSRCPPGWGVVRPCSPEGDTQCEICPQGSYSPHHSSVAKCWTCSRCGPGLYEAEPCTRRADTLCDRCATLKGPHNGDFSRHCNLTIQEEVNQKANTGQQEVTRVDQKANTGQQEVTRVDQKVIAGQQEVTTRLMMPSSDEQQHPITAAPYTGRLSSAPSSSSAASGPSASEGGAATAITVLEITLLVLVGVGACLVARRLNNTCLSRTAPQQDKEYDPFQEATLLQDMKPRIYPDELV